MSKEGPFTLQEMIGQTVQEQVQAILTILAPTETDSATEQLMQMIAPHAALGSTWAHILEMMHTVELITDEDFERLYRAAQRLALDAQKSILVKVEQETDGGLEIPGLAEADIDEEVDKLNAKFRKEMH